MSEIKLGPGAFLEGLFEQSFGRRKSVAAIPPESKYQAEPQEKAKPGRSGKKIDDSLLTSKKPSADLDKAQRIAVSGETVPIVFGKRVNNAGGVWVQPSLVKTGTSQFVGSFLYVISQGQIVSTPAKYRAWIGTRSIAFLSDQSITLAHDYASAATLASAPDVCPIGGSTLYCGVETYSFLQPLTKAEPGGESLGVRNYNYYQGQRSITRGTGDTTNSVFDYTIGDSEVFNSETGADVSSAYQPSLGLNPSDQVLQN